MADGHKPGGAPVFYLGDLHVGQRFTGGSQQPDRGSGRVRSETRNQHDEVVQTFTVRLVPRWIGPNADHSSADPVRHVIT